MAKSKTKSFVVTRKMRVLEWQAKQIEKRLNLANRIYNIAVRHCRKAVAELYSDAWFLQNLNAWRACKDSDPRRDEYLKEINGCISAYGLDEYDIHEYLGKGKVAAWNGCLGINIIQKLGTALHKSVRKAILAGTEIHFRKRGGTNSLEDKTAKTGIVYRRKDDTVSFAGMRFILKPIRKKDVYLIKAMDNKIKYCRIVRKAINGKYQYFLQLVMEGGAPEKLKPGKAVMGVDPGVSTMAAVSNTAAQFFVLADGVEKYDRAIREAAVKYERRRRLANPENYNADGTVKKDTKNFHKKWRKTKGCTNALMELKSAYQKKSAYIKNSHGRQTNWAIRHCCCIVKEPMNYRGLARRAKQLARQDKESVVKKKDGSVVRVRKYKRRKRFGASIGRRSPSLWISMLVGKANHYGVLVENVDINLYRASQYDHSTGAYTKLTLNERGKCVEGHKVQRDLYSAFLMSNLEDRTQPDRISCYDNFPKFLELQGKVVASVLRSGDVTGNFGIEFFVNKNAA